MGPIKSQFNSIVTNNIYIDWILLISCVGILISCAIPNSNALKNIGIYTGLIAASIVIFSESKRLWGKLLPITLLFCCILWVLLLLIFAPENINKQISEFKTTWLNALQFSILGFALGLIVNRNIRIKKFFLYSFFSLSTYYLGDCFIRHLFYSWSTDNPYYGIFHTKAHATYFLIWPFLFSCAFFISSIKYLDNKKKGKGLFIPMVLIILIFINYLNFFFMHSLNGILISTITIFICLYLFCKRVLSIFVKNKLYLFITLFALTMMTIVFISEVNSNKKFANIVNDAAIGWQIDKYSQWKMDSGCIWGCSPKMADGYSPNHSTYFRVASFHKGLLLLIQHPLGSGITHLSYGYYMIKEYPNSIADHTHSGWIDFALGVGLPGLVLVWLAILTTILRNIKIYKNQFDIEPIFNMPIITITSLTGITILWVILEAGEKEYIKHLFFMISFFAAATPVERQKLGKLSSK